jgi:hypothetical protein
MTTHTGKSILISRRAFATSLLASAALGIGVGELAGPLASSQAQPAAVAAKAPAACSQFAVNVGHAFTTLGTLLEDSSKYPPLISQAASAGLHKNTAKINAIAGQVSTINTAVKGQAAKFQALKGPILAEEKQCLS